MHLTLGSSELVDCEVHSKREKVPQQEVKDSKSMPMMEPAIGRADSATANEAA